MKGKGERERYTQLNAEFQRIARRDKKAYLNGQCKEVEENNRMGKARDLFKKTGDIKGTFSVRMGMIQDRNSKDLLKAEETMKRWQEYTELYKVLMCIKVMLKILQARLRQYMNCELPDVQPGFKRQRNQRSNCQHPLDHGKSKRVSEKHLFLLS